MTRIGAEKENRKKLASNLLEANHVLTSVREFELNKKNTLEEEIANFKKAHGRRPDEKTEGDYHNPAVLTAAEVGHPIRAFTPRIIEINVKVRPDQRVSAEKRPRHADAIKQGGSQYQNDGKRRNLLEGSSIIKEAISPQLPPIPPPVSVEDDQAYIKFLGDQFAIQNEHECDSVFFNKRERDFYRNKVLAFYRDNLYGSSFQEKHIANINSPVQLRKDDVTYLRTLSHEDSTTLPMVFRACYMLNVPYRPRHIMCVCLDEDRHV